MAKKKTRKAKKTTRRTAKRSIRRPAVRRAKTIRRRPTRKPARRASRPRPTGQRARAGYAYIVKLGNNYLTADGNYVYGQRYARRFTTRPTGSALVRVTGDNRRPRVVSLHLRQR